jgi:EAL domain-containing protein (putative c-di-GMP-specific phosphodiesterase class I)
VVDNIDQVIQELQGLHKLGCGVSIDDFGTGNSSLDHLCKLPLDILKIDQSFVQDIGVDDQDKEIIRIVMAIADTMGLQVVSEGVETEEQLHFLKQLHCDWIQCYYFSKPLKPDQITEMLDGSVRTFSSQFNRYNNFLAQTQKESAARNV